MSLKSERINNFITALRDEIAAAKEKRSGVNRLSDGQLIGQIGENYIYSFTANRLVTDAEDTPAQIEISGQNYDCSLVAVSGFEVQIAIKSSLGSRIPAAFFLSDKSQILVRLMEKFKTVNSNQFSFADEVFEGKSRATIRVGTRPQYGKNSDDTSPNTSQISAISNSFNNSLAVIWGPPGTGKTRTIAGAVEAHLHAGRRVLLISHANAAVDAALEDIAEQLNENFYAEKKIIRIGVPKNSSLPRKFPLLMLNNVVADGAAHLLIAQEEVNQAIKPLQADLQECLALQAAANCARDLEREIQRPQQQIELRQRYQQILIDIETAQHRLKKAHDNLAAARRSIDAHTQETHIRDLTIFLSTRQQFAKEMEIRLAQIDDANVENHQKMTRADQELEMLMARTGLNPNTVIRAIESLQMQLDPLNQRLEAIENAIASGHKRAISEARVIGTTVTKLFVSPILAEEKFDVVIVDEASMVPLPHLYWALTRADSVTIVGDFEQLPPIVQAKTPLAKKYLGDSIFDVLDIATVEKARDCDLVSMLDVQYRMAPEIAAVSSKLFYGGQLRSAENTSSLSLNDSVFGDKKIVIIDTSKVGSWCTKAGSSRINLYSAGLSLSIARRLLGEHEMTLGIATPYRPQAELIAQGLKESGFGSRAIANTVHSFQGGESTAIIFDCVDGKGTPFSMLSDFGPEQDGSKKNNGRILLNVALTRARSLFVIIVNKQYFADAHQCENMCQFIAELSSRGTTIDARLLDNGFAARNIEDHPQMIRVRSTHPASKSSLYNERDFWSAFHNDLGEACQSALIVSPFLTVKRTEHFTEQFSNMLNKGVKLSVYTKPVEELTQEHMVKEAEAVIAQLTNMGIDVIQRSKLHQKVVIIDDKISWEGSLNILSHKDSLEHMRRLEGAYFASEIRRNLRLD